MSISFPTKDAFDASPLFQYTPDKSPIFTMLSRIHERCDRYEYELFINTIRTSNVWWEMCSDHFGKHKIVLFSTVALFNKTITEEEFLMINLAAVAAQESCLSRVVVVAADRIAEYCHSAGYPLFAPAGAPYILQHRCSDIEEKRKKFVGDWGKRSIVERSMVECSVEAKTDSVINDIIMNHRLVGVAPRLEGGRFTLHLFAPQVSVRLSADASLYDGEAPERHLYMMGHSESGDPLYERRRMISCPYLPIPLNTKEQRLKHAPHGLGESPLQIGTYYHDVCYHIPLEYTNPYVDLTCKLASYFSRKRNPSYAGDREGTNDAKVRVLFLKDLIDRECIEQIAVENPGQAFWVGLDRIMYRTLRGEIPQAEVVDWADYHLKEVIEQIKEQEPSLLSEAVLRVPPEADPSSEQARQLVVFFEKVRKLLDERPE